MFHFSTCLVMEGTIFGKLYSGTKMIVAASGYQDETTEKL